jgi:chorismate mutase
VVEVRAVTTAEAVAARIRHVDDEIARLVGERSRLADQLSRERLAAGSPSYHHSDDVAAVATFVEQLGPSYGGDLAAVVLRRRPAAVPAARSAMWS